MIDTGARRKQVAHARLALDRQQAADVVDAQVGERAVEIDRAVRHVLAVHHRQHALARGEHDADGLHGAVAEQHAAVLHSHEGGGVQRMQVVARRVEIAPTRIAQ